MEQPEEQRHVRRLVSSLRARGGVGALSAECLGEVPEVDGVVLSVLAAGAGEVMLSDSGPFADQVEDQHSRSGQGPHLDATATGDVVLADDLGAPAARSRWPLFAPEMAAAGVNSIFAFPVSIDGLPVGILSLHRGAAGPLSAAGQARARRYSEAAAVLLGDHATGGATGGVVLPVYAGELQQAVGIIMEMGGVDAATALHRMRAYARHSSRPMREVVAEVRTCRLPFDPTAAT